VLVLLATMAAIGSTDPAANQKAFADALARAGLDAGAATPVTASWQALDAGWAALDALAPKEKQRLVEAMVAAVLSDGMLAPNEAELLRAACAVIHVQLPPLVA
jgi:uncharacterized membrane protein YebE (DUF533 family)